MTVPTWNDIDFEAFDIQAGRKSVTVSVSEFENSPVDVEIEHSDDTGAFIKLTLDQARQLAAKLIEAADAAERAGKFS